MSYKSLALVVATLLITAAVSDAVNVTVNIKEWEVPTIRLGSSRSAGRIPPDESINFQIAERRVNDVAKTIYIVPGRRIDRRRCRDDDVGVRPDRGQCNRCEDNEEW